MVKFHMTTAKDKKKAEHHYWRVIVTYSDGGIVRAVKRVQHENQLLMNFDPRGKRVN